MSAIGNRDARGVQARRDRELRDELGADRGVKKALEKFEHRASGWGFRHRRSLLAEAIRLNKRMAPAVSEALADCRAVLGVEQPIEVFLEPKPVYSAWMSKGRTGPLLLGLSSRLLEEFSPAELRFVLGHELGHALFDHLGIPMPITATIEDIGGTLVSRAVQLRLFVWCRAAEVSADRAGLLCAGDAEVAATAFFKMSSGLSRPVIKTDLEAFASQVESMASTPSASHEVRDDDDTLDCFSTHPYTPVRVRALLAFGKSKPFRERMGHAGGGELSLDEVEAVVERDLSLMEPGYLEDKGDEAEKMRRALYCAGVSVAAAHDGVSDAELSALRALLGPKQAKAPEDLTAVRAELDKVLADLATFPLARRAQLVQHLTVIAGVDGHVADEEYAEMSRIAEALAIPPQVIDQTLAGAAAPMD
ncbi:MAG TPA: M48 family metallopeptidase [Kofleriaceae bacterium]|nr:M48 family metallopeptidase [Kofleriaceae bacterium]